MSDKCESCKKKTVTKTITVTEEQWAKVEEIIGEGLKNETKELFEEIKKLAEEMNKANKSIPYIPIPYPQPYPVYPTYPNYPYYGHGPNYLGGATCGDVVPMITLGTPVSISGTSVSHLN